MICFVLDVIWAPLDRSDVTSINMQITSLRVCMNTQLGYNQGGATLGELCNSWSFLRTEQVISRGRAYRVINVVAAWSAYGTCILNWLFSLNQWQNNECPVTAYAPHSFGFVCRSAFGGVMFPKVDGPTCGFSKLPRSWRFWKMCDERLHHWVYRILKPFEHFTEFPRCWKFWPTLAPPL